MGTKLDQLDDNLLGETLIKLPAKTLGQLKVINKRWYSLISHPSFVNKHTTLQTNLHHVCSFFPNFPTVDCCGGNILKVTFDESLPTLITKTTISLDLPEEEFASSTTVIRANSHGLLLIQLRNHICIFNPLTKKKHLIRSPHKRLFCRYGMVFDPTSSSPYHYNVVCLVEARTAYKFKIYVPEQGHWRDSNKSTMIRYGGNDGLELDAFMTSSSPVCFRGSVHWLTRDGHIVAFNVNKEEIKMIEIPKSVIGMGTTGGPWWMCIWFGIVEDEFTLVVVTPKFEIIIWVLHDYENNKWKIKKKDVIKMDSNIDVDCIQPMFFGGDVLISDIIVGRGGMSQYKWLKYNIQTGVSLIPLLSFRDCDRCFPNINTLAEVMFGNNQI